MKLILTIVTNGKYRQEVKVTKQFLNKNKRDAVICTRGGKVRFSSVTVALKINEQIAEELFRS